MASTPVTASPQGDFGHGGGLAREAVTAQLRWSVQMLDSRCPEAVRGELHTAVADLAGVAAWMSFDGLAHNDSRRLFRVAVGCLGEYDWHLRATLLCDMARQEIWCGDPDTGPDVLEMALVRADRLTATERAMASTVRGRPRPHPWWIQLSCSASPMMMPSGPRMKQSR